MTSRNLKAWSLLVPNIPADFSKLDITNSLALVACFSIMYNGRVISVLQVIRLGLGLI